VIAKYFIFLPLFLILKNTVIMKLKFKITLFFLSLLFLPALS